MKSTFTFLVMTMMTNVLGANPQLVIGKSHGCSSAIVIRAQVGEKSIKLMKNKEEYVLFPDGNYVFMLNPPFDLVFNSYNRRADSHWPHFKYVHPSAARSSQGELVIQNEKSVERCQVQF